MERIAENPSRDQSPALDRAAGRPLLKSPRALLGAVALAALIASLLLAGGAILYTSSHQGRVYRGVSVAGVGLGGLTRDAALARLSERVAAYTARPVRTRTAVGEGSWTIAPDDLGVEFAMAAAVDEALAVGRGSGPLRNIAGWAGAALGRHNVTPGVALDESRLDQTLRAWAIEATYWPTDARFAVTPEGTLAVVPDQDGLGIDVDGSRAAFLEHAAGLAQGPVTLAQAPVRAGIDAQMLREAEPQAQAITGQPLALWLDGRYWILGSEDLRAALGYRKDGEGRLVVALDPARLQPLFGELAGTVARPSTNAQLTLDPRGRYAIRPGQDGTALDDTATLVAINAALMAGEHNAPAVLKAQPPAITTADLEPVRARVEQILSTKLVVTFDEGGTQPYSRTFVRADLQPLLTLTEQPDAAEKVAIALDGAGLRQLTLFLAGELNQGVRDAEFRWLNRAVRDVVSSRDGREVQLATTERALGAAILGATGMATPTVFVTKPQVASSEKAKMVITDRLDRGQTTYNAGDVNRSHNVELAMERLNGTLIAPDEVFSFNETVGEQTVAAGYKEGFGIELVASKGGGAGQIKTVPVIGGGVCQVSTTLFHAVFRAGLEIEERNWHLYWVPYAAASPTGLQGLDATVYYESDVDFKFKNTTGGWLAIEAGAGGGSAQVVIWGKNPGWEVKIDPPVISNGRKADPEPLYEKTHDLPSGQTRVSETARDGFDAMIRRQVFDRTGKLLRAGEFRSNYRPTRQVIQVGVPPNEPLDGAPPTPGAEN